MDSLEDLQKSIQVATKEYVLNYLMRSNIDPELVHSFVEHKAQTQARALIDELFNFTHHNNVEEPDQRDEVALLSAIGNAVNKPNTQDVVSTLLKILLEDLGISDRLLAAWIDDDIIPDELKDTVLTPMLSSITVQT